MGIYEFLRGVMQPSSAAIRYADLRTNDRPSRLCDNYTLAYASVDVLLAKLIGPKER